MHPSEWLTFSYSFSLICGAAQAVPVAEPEWSAAYKGLCLYMARVLQPAWEEEIMVPISPGSPALKPNIPHHTLMVCRRSSCSR